MNNSNNKKRTGPSKQSSDRKKTSSTPKPAMDKRSQNRKPIVKKDSPNIPKPIKSDEIRLNKYISNSGACSRRDADIYIQSGNVKVNGIPVTEMGYKVKPGFTDLRRSFNFQENILNFIYFGCLPVYFPY